MWIFTKNGFVSAVQHRSKPAILLVRARDRRSLEQLVDYTSTPDLPNEIIHTPDADYPYRTEIEYRQFSRWLVDEVYNLDYANYKDEVHHTRGDEFARPLHSVWSIMHEVEDDDARSTEKHAAV